MLSSLPSELGTMEQLRVLSIRECKSLYKIPKSLARLANLTKLLMPSCGVARFLHSELQGLQNLRLLDLSRCFGLKELPSTLGDLVALTALNLGGCWQLSNLPCSIGELVELEILLLNGCSNLGMIPDSVTRLGNLIELDVQECTSLTSLPSGIGKGCLELGSLHLQGNFALAFPEFVHELKNLHTLGLPMRECTNLGEGQAGITIFGTQYSLPNGWRLSDALLEQVHLEKEETRECQFNLERVSYQFVDCVGNRHCSFLFFVEQIVLHE